MNDFPAVHVIRAAAGALLVTALLFPAARASAQDYPVKPVRILTSAPGDGQDLAARVIAQGLGGSLGQQVIVDNRVSLISIETVAKSAPDGYTLLVAGNPLWVLPLLRDSITWDPVRDFSPISMAVTSTGMVVVHPSVPAKSVRELIALAKARPGQLNYASGPTGSTNHLSAEVFKAMAGINLVRVSYRGSGPALTDLMTGQVQVMFPNAAAAIPHLKSGRLRALAVTAAQPSALAPGLPTVAASGVPGYESGSIFAVFAPAKLPAALVNRLNQEITRVITQPETREKFFNLGLDVVGGSPEQFAATIKSEMTRLGKVIRDGGIRAE